MAISEAVAHRLANDRELDSALTPDHRQNSAASARATAEGRPLSTAADSKTDLPMLSDITNHGKSVNENGAVASAKDRLSEANAQEANAVTASQALTRPGDPVNHPPDRHPNHDEILRQVEYYFSDDNLPGDAHLLARTGPSGDNWVSINEILGFAKMRKHKPKTLVKKSLAMSKFVEVTEDGRFIRRRTPLTSRLRVKPAVSEKRERDRKLVDQPWLTKAMFKPTGFEEYATDGPITPQQYEEERKLFDPEEAFTVRIEAAVNRFVLKRKMHQTPALVFTKFMLFGGFQMKSDAFSGRRSKKDLEEYDAEELAEMQARYSLNVRTYDGLHGVADDETTWMVDFEGMAKAFLSSEFFQRFDWRDQKVLIETTNVLRKFYNYLLHHDVCPEYEEAIVKARDICHLAGKELPKLAELDSRKPGDFNKACSILYNGTYAQSRPSDPNADWVMADDVKDSLSDKDAWAIFSASLTAYGTDAQLKEVMKGMEEAKHLLCLPEKLIGIEITKVEFATEDAKPFYNSEHLRGTVVKPAGKLHCKRWTIPHARPADLPPDVLAARRSEKHKRYEFIVEEEILAHCVPGMKMEVVVKELECGVNWIDVVDNVYPSFYTWTLNERVREWKHPAAPKDRMMRVAAKANGTVVGGEADGDAQGEAAAAGEQSGRAVDAANGEGVDEKIVDETPD